MHALQKIQQVFGYSNEGSNGEENVNAIASSAEAVAVPPMNGDNITNGLTEDAVRPAWHVNSVKRTVRLPVGSLIRRIRCCTLQYKLERD